MFKKILIANRGEIALRVIFACKELGIPTVAVFSEADRDALHVRFADEAVCIGPPKAANSYLNVPGIISAAEITNADAIHPGYGFLSESAYFAEVCEACRIRFIGPPAEAIRIMGDKIQARNEMKRAGLPVLPGSDHAVADADQAIALATEMGFPVIIKAAAGGGGRGMRIVRSASELAQALTVAQAEAESAFGIANCYIEKYVERARHIEFQVLGDRHGNVIHVGERECSIQRRHQKLIEESPSVIMTEELRRDIGDLVVRAVKAIGYTNAGTLEFLVDENQRFYFMEMNTRIQVEHGVTELVTGVDLVKEQIRSAAGQKLRYTQDDISIRGHALECRINAEDPVTHTPSPGRIVTWHVPGGPGVRVDTAAYAEYQIPPYYDSLIAKLLTYGSDRAEAIQRMKRALDTFVIEGVQTTVSLHKAVMRHADFCSGAIHTRFLDQLRAEMVPSEPA